MPKTLTETQKTILIKDQFDRIWAKLADLDGELTQLKRSKPAAAPTMARGTAVEVDLETKRQMAVAAQCLGLRGADELAQIVLHAFIEMYEEDQTIEFPLVIQQVETVR
jgi:hypothetical protein